MFKVKEINTVFDRTVITIIGNGDGITNGSKLSDENNNTITVDTVTMVCGKKNGFEETMFSVKDVDENIHIGKTLFLITEF